MIEIKKYLNVADIMELTGYKESKSYQLIRCWNKELKSKGIFTFNGRIPAKFVYEKLYI